MSQILQPYELAIVTSDVQSTETLSDLLYALQQLSVTVDDIFGRIDRRINDERARVSSINNRVSTCQQKVQLVKGSNRATTVFSTAKFPAPKTLPLYNSLFNQMKEVTIKFEPSIFFIRGCPYLLYLNNAFICA